MVITSPSPTAPRWTIDRLLLTAFLLRVALVFYARIHDSLFDVAFTDVDYRVFSDAAQLVVEGKSPYDRPTYRYTPLLAWILAPNTILPDFGKILFCSVDIVAGWLLYKLALHSSSFSSSSQDKNAIQSLREDEKSRCRFGVAVFWLFNPLVAIVSARGNAESLVCTSVLLSLYLLQVRKEWLMAAIVHGALAIHLKIYPIIYLPSIFLYLAVGSAHQWGFVAGCARNIKGLVFVGVSLLFFLNCVAIGYMLYGDRFLEEFLIYHLKRSDVRHNFSPYFYPLYLALGNAQMTRWISLGAFVPQAATILLFAFKYHRDLPFCWFLTTYSFVTLNKVSTSQYFSWYLCFLPLIYCRLKICPAKGALLGTWWFVGQAQWLLPAYLLEFKGWNTLVWTWVASLAFMGINFYIMGSIIWHRSNDEGEVEKKEQ